MPTELTPDQLSQLRELIFARRKIEAIKLYHTFTGLGLKESKDWVEAQSAEFEAKDPTQFAAKPKGCAAAILLLLVLAALLLLAVRAKAADSPSLAVPGLDEALAAQTDVWGELALQQSNGPTYEFFKKLLPPLRYVNAAFRFYPIVLSAPASAQKARLVSNGSELNAKANLNTWKEVGIPITFHVGEDEQVFGNDLRRLDGPHYFNGYLPIVQLSYWHDDTMFSEESFAATQAELARDGVVFVRFALEHGTSGKVSAAFDPQKTLILTNQALCETNGHAWAWFGPEWKWNATEKKLITELRGKKPAILAVATKPSTNNVSTAQFKSHRKQCVATWQSLLDRASQIEVPEKIVNDAWRGLLVNNFSVVTGNKPDYSAGNVYQCFYEAECGDTMRAFSLWGYTNEPSRMLKPLFDYTRGGLVFHNAGFKLQTLSHLFWLTRDKALLEKMRPDWTREVKRILDAREKDSGLLPRERYCGDIGTRVYSLHSNAACWRGLRDFAAVLAEIGETEEAKKLTEVATEYREKILAAIDKSEFRNTQPPFIPIALFGEEKPYDVLTATMLGSYWDLIAPYVLGSEIFRGTEREDWVLQYLQQHGGVLMGMIRFDQHSGLFANHESLDDLYGLRYITTLLRRDDVDRVLVGFYGKLAQGLTPDTFYGAEGTRLKSEDEFGRAMYLPPNSTAQALLLWQLRYMLVQDWDLSNDGTPDTLRLLFATPRQWLRDGAEIKVQNAPTAFGEISLRIRSRLSHGEVVADISAPTRNQPSQTLLRLRLPEGWQIVSANCGSQKLSADEKGTVDISSLKGKSTVRCKVRKI